MSFIKTGLGLFFSSGSNFTILESSSDNVAVVKRLISFSSLPKGWHFGSGVPPSGETVRMAITIVLAMQQAGAQKFEAFPAENGGILISGYNGSDMMEVFCAPTRAFSFALEVDDEEVEYLEGLDLNEVMQ